MKASRNDPCPCGSGAKYKRCCLAKDQAETVKAAAAALAAVPPEPELTEEDLELEDQLDRDAWSAAAVDRPFDEDEAPWELARFAEQDDLFAKARARDAAWEATPALPGEVENLTQAELRERLRKLGVDASEDAFLAAARAALERGEPSGWAVARAWRAGKTLTRPERDFLGIAACELWVRTWPKEPSKEMLEDAIEEGRLLLEKGEGDAALGGWRLVLDVVLRRLRPGGQTLADSKTAGDPAVLGEWLEDWLDELHARAQDDPGAALEGLRLCETLLERVPAHGGPGGGTTRAARVDFLLALGRDAEARAEATRLRDEHPDHAIGYIALAQVLTFADHERDPERLAEALSVISAALARPVSDAAEWKLEGTREAYLKLLRRARAGS